MQKKSTLKKILIGFSVLFCVLLIAVGVIGYQVLKQLPSPSQIGKMMNSQKQKPLNATGSASKNVPAATQPKEGSTLEALKEAAHIQDERKLNKYVEGMFLDYSRPLISVCEKLNLARESELLKVGVVPKDENEFFKTVGDALDKNPDDPFAESMFSTVRYVFRFPRAKDLIETVEAAKGGSDRESTMAEKAIFYSKAVMAYREMHAHQKEINDFSMRTYHLFVLGQAVRDNPELANAPEMQSYCQSIQKSMNEDVPYNATVEATEMQKFLSWARIPPESVNFNPNMKSNMNIELSDNQFKMSLGWMGELMNTTQEKSTN